MSVVLRAALMAAFFALAACGKPPRTEISLPASSSTAAVPAQEVKAAESPREPVYRGVAISVASYLPFNLDNATITGAYGNKASGQGSSTCCYTLRGTEFTVTWDYYDQDEWLRTPQKYLGEKKARRYHGETKVSYRPTESIPRDTLAPTFAIHIFPDHHVELGFPEEIVPKRRLPLREAARWMDRYPELDARIRPQGLAPRAPPMFDHYATRDRAIERAIAEGWLKYRLTTVEDLGTYAYFRMAVNKRFDAHPAIQPLLAAGKDKPGSVAKGLDGLSPAVMKALKDDRFTAVAVPAIDPKVRPLEFEPDGLALRTRPRGAPRDASRRSVPSEAMYWRYETDKVLRRYPELDAREEMAKLPPEKRHDGPWRFETSEERFSAMFALTREAWRKYELFAPRDLAIYMYFALAINERFDAHPVVHEILLDGRDDFGYVAKALDNLPSNVLAELKSNRFTPVEVPYLAPDQRFTEKLKGTTP
ncbi:hypothetical protein [Luteibacter sp.]|jgi:hypothetical protein|uniref:hypothetical protein n=1 Tax=Luteibacter sp. TaxID=1886636 RepID=UPI002F402B1F